MVMLVVTDGSKGTWDPDLSVDELVALRRAEQEQAARTLGAEEVVFLDHPDGELEYTMALREELCLWIRRVRPGVVVGHDPWRRYMLHPDHRAAGWGTVDGVVAARDHLFYPDQLEAGTTAHRPDWMLLWAPDQADHWEDISETLEQKLEALLCHRSQAASTMGGAQLDPRRRVEFRERIASEAADMGRPRGLAAAEAFKRIRP